ncbi:alpha/beta hydrolase [Brucella pseudogrignonensis]|uniref:Pimeloyl-ACP methyl ester carboxylesterase n=1 Tax=Brucella pseudogrignonensis TaxID=419475 RepID=A0ABU1MC12_9HYPH|nr:alpha/beta hydrolase [Brucella pseudogrignonensis]MDR6433588.1 pimeloyl-ACP methyl ester carboxylesterase [Brucella pseudogrignonensis]
MMTNLGNYQLSSILISPVNSTIEATILFIHGASCSLLDPYFTFSDLCLQDMQMLFVDRPGHGQSEQGPAENIRPDAQADAIARLMQIHGIDNAIIVGHSYGGAVAAALAVRHPERVAGLIFLSPAVYPWVGGISWYNNLAKAPIIGALFTLLVAPTIGLLSLKKAMKSVFTPNKYPSGYTSWTKAWQTLRPRAFRHNARELGALCKWAETTHKNYKQIKAPTIIITGDTDDIVSPDVHARRLANDITLSELYVIKGMGHKSDYVARDLVSSAIEKVAGRDIDLSVVARQVERQIVDEAKDEKGPV